MGAGVFCSDRSDYPTSTPPGSLFLPCELDTSLNRNNSGAHEERTHIVEDLACTRHRRCMQRSQPIVQSNYLRLPRAHRAHSLAAISDKHHPIKTIQSEPGNAVGALAPYSPYLKKDQRNNKEFPSPLPARPGIETARRPRVVWSRRGSSYESGTLTYKGGLRH